MACEYIASLIAFSCRKSISSFVTVRLYSTELWVSVVHVVLESDNVKFDCVRDSADGDKSIV